MDKTEQEESDLTIGFSFQELRILGAFTHTSKDDGEKETFKTVEVVGYIMDPDKDDIETAIIVLHTDTFHAALEAYLERKANICDSYGEYCGVWGDIIATDFEIEEETVSLMVDFDDTKGEDGEPVYENVRRVVMFDYDPLIDMEHG